MKEPIKQFLNSDFFVIMAFTFVSPILFLACFLNRLFYRQEQEWGTLEEEAEKG